jgi:DegV family protein with EDD domain
VPGDIVASHQIEVVPLQVLFGSDAYRDGVDISTYDFYRRLKEAKELPHTSQPSAGEFAEAYKRLTADGSSVVSIHISSKLSGTVASAQAARDMVLGGRVSVVDTMTASMAMGLVVIRAAEAARAGHSHEDVVALAEDLSTKVEIQFIVDTLEYLQKGGRIGGAAALLASMLSVKPVLTVREGRVEALERVRTKSKAVERLVERIGDAAAGGRLHLAVLHGNAPAEANALAESLQARFNPVEIYTGEVGPTIATHTGPGVVGAAFYVEK